MTTPVTTGTVPVNGLEMYYEDPREASPGAVAWGLLGDRLVVRRTMVQGMTRSARSSVKKLPGHGRARRHRP